MVAAPEEVKQMAVAVNKVENVKLTNIYPCEFSFHEIKDLYTSIFSSQRLTFKDSQN